MVAVRVGSVHTETLPVALYGGEAGWHVVVVQTVRFVRDVMGLANVERVWVCLAVVSVVADGLHTILSALHDHQLGVGSTAFG